MVDDFESRIREPLQAFPTMAATVVVEWARWIRGKPVFADRLRKFATGVSGWPNPASQTS
jgi:hypothetical protein